MTSGRYKQPAAGQAGTPWCACTMALITVGCAPTVSGLEHDVPAARDRVRLDLRDCVAQQELELIQRIGLVQDAVRPAQPTSQKVAARCRRRQHEFRKPVLGTAA